MKHIHTLAAALALSLVVTAANAGHAASTAQVSLLTPVTFAPTTDPRAEVRDECKMGEMLETRVGDALRRLNKGPGTTTDPAQGDVLKVTVTTIWGARGNNWTGPKGLALEAQILHDGVVQRSTNLHRTTMGGFWGAFKGICGFMDRDTVSIAKDLARWSRDPKFVPPSEDVQAPDTAGAPTIDSAAASAPATTK
ncbi:MAG: hypothetical protein ACJ8G1_28365 [Vitreoscilla sp.]